MTNATLSPGLTLTPGQRRIAAAQAVRMRRSEERWADHLRNRGWTVVKPEVIEILRDGGADHPADHACAWCTGYRAALEDVLTPADVCE